MLKFSHTTVFCYALCALYFAVAGYTFLLQTHIAYFQKEDLIEMGDQSNCHKWPKKKRKRVESLLDCLTCNCKLFFLKVCQVHHYFVNANSYHYPVWLEAWIPLVIKFWSSELLLFSVDKHLRESTEGNWREGEGAQVSAEIVCGW